MAKKKVLNTKSVLTYYFRYYGRIATWSSNAPNGETPASRI